MIFLRLFYEFFRIGIFSFGGGYATIPFLYHISDNFGWYSHKQLLDMIVVSSVTPGPLGINIATYTGFTTSGIFGALIATLSVVLPSFIFVIIVSKLLQKFKTNKIVQGILYGIKPAGCALLVAVAVGMLLERIDILSLTLFLVLLLLSFKKRDPLFYFIFSAIAGIILGIFSLI